MYILYTQYTVHTYEQCSNYTQTMACSSMECYSAQHAHLKYFLAIYENIEAAILGVRQEHGARDKRDQRSEERRGTG